MRVTALAGLMAAFFFLATPTDAQSGNQLRENEDQTPLINSIQGQALYNAYCAVCHGTTGKGNGPMAQSLKGTVPDLTQIARRNGGRFLLERVQKIISGETQQGVTHGTRQMPVWGPIFSEVTRDRDIGRVRVYNLAKHIEGIQRN
jgi:mono/diheme cytochrome c family protein